MKVKEVKTFWGIPINTLETLGKKRSILSKLVYILDIIVTIVSCIIMYNSGSDLKSYIFVLVALCLITTLLLDLILGGTEWTSYKTYRKIRNYTVSEYKLKITDRDCFAILFGAGYSRAVTGKSLEEYKEMILSACSESKTYAKRITKYLMRYIISDDDEDALSVYIADGHNKNYFIDFKEREESEDAED